MFNADQIVKVPQQPALQKLIYHLDAPVELRFRRVSSMTVDF